MKRTATLMVLLTAGLLTACSGPQKAETVPTETTPDVADTAEAAESAADDPTKDAKRTWEVQIEGQPKLDGYKVMVTDLPHVKKYTMLGSDAMMVVDLKDGQPDPASFMANFTATELNCSYRADNKNGSAGITVEITDNRAEISGEVSCATPNAEDQAAVSKVTGWFEF